MLAQGARSGVTCLIPAATDAMRLIALAALLAVPLAIAAVPQTTHQTGFAYIGFSNDGKLALTSSYYHDGEQGEFKLWNVADGRLLCTQPARYERATNAREVSPGVFEMEDERSKGPPRYLRFFVEGCRVEPMAGPSGSFSVGPIEDDKGQRVALQGGPSVQGYRPQVLATGGQDAYACVEDPARGCCGRGRGDCWRSWQAPTRGLGKLKSVRRRQRHLQRGGRPRTGYQPGFA